MANRVITYIDGYNLYHGLRDASFQRYYWLSPRGLARSLLKPDQELVKVKYFTSRVSGPPDTAKRQTIFLEAVATLPDVQIFEGQYDAEEFTCPRCGHQDSWHNEKMTDVNIAIELAKDAFGDQFDTALLITGDADQTPTVKMVRALFPQKRVACAFPPKRVSSQLKRFAHGFVHINEPILSACQMPREVTKADGFVLKCPEKWQ